ncbi:MAG: hypothetical protein ACTSO6_03865 [Promethearchaeota archaeon]
MDKKIMISGVKRKSTATESASRFFQTVDLIISHLKREADKEKIFELIRKEPTLRSLLIATASVHLYHYMGIEVKDTLDTNKLTVDSTKQLEMEEKYILMEEVEIFLKNSFELERALFDEIINLENMFLSLLIDERMGNLQKSQRGKRIEGIENQIERELLKIISKSPSYYFYDFIGDIIGLNEIVKNEILEESAAFKGVSLPIEEQLKKEEKEDQFIEVFTLNRIIERMQNQFEFKSYKELQIQTMSIRMIKKHIIEYELNKFPISISGLKTFIEGNNLKKETIKSIENAFKENLKYDEFEKKILSELKTSLIKQLKKNPNDFIYFLQSVNESSFEDAIFLLNKRGIKDTLHLMNVDYELAENVQKSMIRYNIKKQDLILLNDNQKNLINVAKKALCSMKFSYLEKFVTKVADNVEFDLFKILYRNETEYNELWDILEKKIGFTINDLREFVRKKQTVDKIFFQGLNLTNYSQIILLLNYDEILSNLVTDLFYNLLSKILRQLSRIIEMYGILSNDKAIYSRALKVVTETNGYEDWVQVKLEELSIERTMKRQQELVVVFNAVNQVFLINGFILSRLKTKSLEESIVELKTRESYVYKGISPLKLKADLVSPVSYCIAYDLIKRFEELAVLEKVKIESANVEKKKIEDDKKKEIIKLRQESTFNWVERRISSSIMGVTRGMNPRQFYWNDKDNKTLTEQVQLHSGLGGDIFSRFCEFYLFVLEKIKSLVTDMKLPNKERIEHEIATFIKDVLSERLNRPSNPEEINEMLEGERYKISNNIAKEIGSILDKTLYFKFKKKPKK